MKNTARKERKANKTAEIIQFPQKQQVNQDCDEDLVDLNEIVTGGKEGFLCYTVLNSCGVIAMDDLVFVDSNRKPRIGEYVFSGGNVEILTDTRNSGIAVVGFLRKFKEAQ